MNLDEKLAARQYRSLAAMTMPPEQARKRIDCTRYVEGYAARFEPYVLYDLEDGPIYETFERGCFATADMSDIIMQYNHQGRVLARLSNGSLIVEPDDNGLFVAANLDLTEASRQLFEEIKTRLVTKMSWGFVCGDYDYNPETRTITHHTVKKIFDVSAVSIPANDTTEINARAWADGVIGFAARSEAALEERRRKLRLKIKIQEDFKHE